EVGSSGELDITGLTNDKSGESRGRCSKQISIPFVVNNQSCERGIRSDRSNRCRPCEFIIPRYSEESGRGGDTANQEIKVSQFWIDRTINRIPIRSSISSPTGKNPSNSCQSSTRGKPGIPKENIPRCCTPQCQ